MDDAKTTAAAEPTTAAVPTDEGKRTRQRASAARAGVNPITSHLGEPRFEMPGSARRYPIDDQHPERGTNGSVAVAIFDLGAVLIHANVYMAEAIEKTAEGTFATRTYSVSLPKGIKLSSPMAAHADAWKATVLDAFDAWRKSGTATTGSAQIVKRAEIRERVAVQP